MRSTIDFSECHVRTPTGDALVALYRMLMDAFPVDRPVFTEMIEKGKRFYTWTPYALYRGDELLGNVSLMPVRIWLGGRPVEVVGVASVATCKAYRKQGIAKHLMQHALAVVDRREAPAVLFTGLPGLYERLGFKTVGQTYPAVPVRQMHFPTGRLDGEPVDRLDQGRLEQMARVYSEAYPDYDGKIVRDPDYWQLYQMLFDLCPKARILCSNLEGRMVGYARCELEGDRLLVSELCGPADSVDVARALLGFVGDYARQVRRDVITLALPSGHFGKRILADAGVPLAAEPPGARRETFMVRPQAGEALGPLGRLEWSLADKF